MTSATQTHPGLSPKAAEWGLAAFVLLAMLAAAWLPPVMLPDRYHAFADQRGLFGLPHAMDVLTNLPFAAVGAFLFRAAWRARERLSATQRSLAYLTSIGLLATAFCSSIYHLWPDAGGLALDRLGMVLVFTGVLGLAAASRVSDRAGWLLACGVGAMAPLAALWDLLTANMTPWIVLQGGGLMLLLVLALRPLRAEAVRVALWPILGLYVLAKLLELADAPVLALTQGFISGHSAKHLVAAAALWPMVVTFWRMIPCGQAFESRKIGAQN
ncbi:MAG: hypothetical protein WBC18_18455 [Ottowia sp.]|uniref:hypothetical protein n=1 Tax=Ottowia sp. TaxID=1898956 RepID=UPI003C75E26A